MATSARSIPIQDSKSPETTTSEPTPETSKMEEVKRAGETIAAPRVRAESDIEMGKEQGDTGTSTSPSTSSSASQEQKDADELLLWIARYGVDRNHPRPTTGSIRVGKSGEVMTVQVDEKVNRIFQKLITEGFLSAPVLDSHSRYTGYNIDLLDLVHHTLTCFHEWRTSASSPTSVTESVSTDYWNSYFQRDEFIRSHAMDVITRNDKRAFRHEHIAKRDFSTLYCMEIMARLGQHRVIVIDRNWTVTNIITQSMIISLISQNMNRLGALRSLPVSQIMEYLPAHVETVRQSDLIADAFQYMISNNVSGVGIVNPAGDLVDTLSVRDLRGIGSSAQHFMRLWLPVHRFKEEVRDMFPRQTPARPLFVTPTDTFEKIIENMYDGNIHRVWIVQSVNEMKPLRVCTQRDVIRILLTKMGQTLPPISL